MRRMRCVLWKRKLGLQGITVLALALCSLLHGCKFVAIGSAHASLHHVDVTENQELWGGFERGVTYELLEETFLMEPSNRAWGKHPALVPPRDLRPVGGMERSSPNNPKWYEENKKEWDEKYPDVWGVLKPEDRIETFALYKWGTDKVTMRAGELKWSKKGDPGRWTLYVLAKIKTGPHAGTTVELYDMSSRVSGNKLEGEMELRGPEPRLLRKVEEQ